MSIDNDERQIYEELIRKDEQIRILKSEKDSLVTKYAATQDKLKTSEIEIAQLNTFKESAERVQKFIMNSLRAAVLFGCTMHFLTTQFDSTYLSYNSEQKGIEFHMYGFDPNLSHLPVYAALLSTVMVPYDTWYKDLDVDQVIEVVRRANPVRGKGRSKP